MKFAVLNKSGNFLKADNNKVVDNFKFLPFDDFEKNRKDRASGASVYPIWIQEFDDSNIGVNGASNIFEAALITFRKFPGLEDLIKQKELFLVPHPYYRIVGLQSGHEVVINLLEGENYGTIGKQLFQIEEQQDNASLVEVEEFEELL